MNNAKKSLVPHRRFKEFQNAGAWEQYKLGDVATIVGGGTPSTKIADYWDGAINWYSPAEINEQVYMNNSERKITEHGLIKSSATMLPVDTVLFTSRAGIGKMAILGTEACTNQGFQSIVPRKKELDSYFIYSMKSQLKHYGETHGAGSTFVEVSGKQMAKMPTLLPKYEEQVRISSMFKELDSLITLHQRKLNKLKKLKSAYLTEMFPAKGECKPKRRFVGFIDNWEQRKLGDISDVTKLAGFEFTNYVQYSSTGSIIALRGLNVKDGELVLDDVKYIDKSDFSKLKRSKLYIGDILFTYVGTIGQLAVVPLSNKFYLAPNVSRIRVFNKINQFFISYQMETNDFYNHIIFPLIATSSQPALSMTNIRKFKLNVPSTDEQQKISKLIKIVKNYVDLQQRKIDKLKKLKDAYLNEMFV